MKFVITEDKIRMGFDKLMSEYSNIESNDRFYDYYDDESGSWVENVSLNFYKDPEIDWEGDNWVFQYQKEFGGDDNPQVFPRLIYDVYEFENISSLFGQMTNDLMKKWFEENYGLEVTTSKIG